ncbi:MAG: double-strand break repair protein AddB, partial [Sphingomonadaceae bacterium]|nr:double-strand break repair protein AddB [Sphingomonadaceae bacterium]
MPEAPRPRVFTIPPHRPFANALAAGLLRQHRDPMALARGIVLLPNSRAKTALTDAFVRRAEGGLLLPRLVIIGDPELDEALGSALDPIGAAEPIPPAIDAMERRMRLANLVQQVRMMRDEPIEAAEAVRLAGELGRMLDQLQVEEVAAHDVLSAVDPNLSEHWKSSLAELEIVLSKWPEELARIDKIDLTHRRNLLLRRIAGRWAEAPSPGFVVAAGITSTAPAIAAVQRTVAFMADGMVVLPALDLAMDEDEWEALGPFERDPETGFRPRSIETHPQFQFKLLLDRMGVARGEVAVWRHGGGRDAPAARSRAIGHAMAPAEFTDRWDKLSKRARRVTGVRGLVLAQPAEEAQTIALAIREAIESEGRTAALVTPDRGLARRVAAHLKRWGIDADDSAGRPLAELPAGTLLLAIAEAAAARFAPVQLLALLKHPLVRMGEDRLKWLDEARALDMALRGPRPGAGLAGVGAHLRGLIETAWSDGR